MNQDMYYIAIAEGQTEGPVSLQVLEDYFNQKKINANTLVFQEGGQEWEECEKVLEKYRQNKEKLSPSGIKRLWIVAIFLIVFMVMLYFGWVWLVLDIGVLLLLCAIVRFLYHILHNMKPKESETQNTTSQTKLGYYFVLIAIFSLVAGIIGFCVALGEEMVGIGVACLLSGFFSLMFFLWMGKIYDRIAECVLLLKNMQNNNK